MRTNGEIVRAVHARAQAKTRRRESVRTALTGCACVMLAGLVILMISSFGGLQHAVRSTGFAGASLLSDSAGGYILAAVVAFMAGVIVMVVRQSKLKKEQAKKDEQSVPGEGENPAE